MRMVARIAVLMVMLSNAQSVLAICSSSISLYGYYSGKSSIVINLDPTMQAFATNLSGGLTMWNGGCAGMAGSNYPSMDFGSTAYYGNGLLNVVYAPGTFPTADCGGQYCTAGWDQQGNIIAHELFGPPDNLQRFDNLSAAQMSTIMAHELGHALGLADDACTGGIMNVPVNVGEGITTDECNTANQDNHVAYEGTSNEGCASRNDCHVSPLILHLQPGRFATTGLSDSVTFDINATGQPVRLGWTSRDGDEAFLWIDKNGNGIVDDGSELFGSVGAANGFEALAVYDRKNSNGLLYGGNADGMITSADSVWHRLRLWVDSNHDGTCQPGEVFTLDEKRVTAIDLGYHWTGRHDQAGNQFRYEATARVANHAVSLYDVYFVTSP